MSSFNGGEPTSPKLRLAVLGDSDSHSFHDAVSLHYGTPEARGGAQQASTWQWTEILGRLRPRDIDQGPFGEVGSSGAGAWLRRNVMGSLVRQHKEDFRYNFAFSGATCGALNNPTFGQVPGLLAEMARDPQGWQDVPSVVLIRIGINSLGKREDLQAFAKTGADADNLARVQACADQVAQAVSALKARDPALDIIDEPWNAVIGDGHAGTVWNGLWAAAMVDEFNRIKGLDIPPIQPVEIARAADPDRRFGLSE